MTPENKSATECTPWCYMSNTITRRPMPDSNRFWIEVTVTIHTGCLKFAMSENKSKRLSCLLLCH